MPKHGLYSGSVSSCRRHPIRTVVVSTCIAAFVALLGPWALAGALSYGKVHDVADTEPRDVAIVLGAQVLPSGTPSAYLRGRLDVAADLYRSGKAKVILVSGDHRETHYNEPKVMKTYLVSKGVPAARISRTSLVSTPTTPVFGLDGSSGSTGPSW